MAVVAEESSAKEANAWCAAIYPRLVGALSLACGNRDDAEELAQETLSRVWQRWDRLRDHPDIEGFAFRTGFNLVNSWWRHRAVVDRIDRLLRRNAPTGADDADTVTDALALRRAISHLPRRQREVIAYRYFLDCTVADTAVRMQCAEGTVKALTHQAIDALRASGAVEMDDDGDADDG